MKSTLSKTILATGLVLGLLCALALGWAILGRLRETPAEDGRGGGVRAVPVEAVPVERGALALRRVFSGSLESPFESVVAPKVAGRVERFAVDAADVVERGQAVAWLDNDEYLQAVAAAEAELAVARARLGQARSALEIAVRGLGRVETLAQRGVASEVALDTARAEQLARQAELEVAEAEVQRADAALAQARIRLGYTEVRASWTGAGEHRVVAERFVDDGATVSANTPLLRIVELDPILAVIHVPERDYARLSAGQPVELTTDAYPGDAFRGRVERVAPVFRQSTRQARVEIAVENPDQRLRPGMFVRAVVVLDRVEDATIVPEAALTTRDGRSGVFVLAAGADTVEFRPVEPGIRQDGRVSVVGPGVEGRVVTLGQHLLADGSRVVLPDPGEPARPEDLR